MISAAAKTDDLFPLALDAIQVRNGGFEKYEFHGTTHRAFSLVVPDAFEPGPVAESERQRYFFPLAHFVDALDPQATVTVDCCELEHEVNPSDWLQLDLVRQTSEVLRLQEYRHADGTTADILSVDADSLIRRSVTYRNGPMLLSVHVRATRERFTEFSEDLFISLRSLRFLDHRAEELAESLSSHQLSVNRPFQFAMPASWVVSGSRNQLKSSSTSFTKSFCDSPVGSIVVQIWNNDDKSRTPQRLLSDHVQSMRQQGVEIQGAPLLPAAKLGRARAWSFAAHATFASEPVSFLAMVIDFERDYVLFSLTGPTRNAFPEWWSVNKRAFELVHWTLSEH